MIPITKGPAKVPIMAAIYGVEGVGKTTLAASLPGALIIDLEGGAAHYDVSRVDGIDTYEKLINLIQEIINTADSLHAGGYFTIVIDSLDAMENLLLIPFVLKMNGKPSGSLSDWDWGRGWDLEGNEFKNFLYGCGQIVQKGFNVVFVVHCQQKDINPPDNPPYSHYELKLNKKLCAYLKEKVDMLLFATYETYTVKEGNTSKAKGAKRVLVCSHTAYADAKNRFGLPERIEMDPTIISKYFPVLKASEKDE